MAAGGPGGT